MSAPELDPVPFDEPATAAAPKLTVRESSDFRIGMVKHALDTDTTEESFRKVVSEIASGRWRAQVQAVRDAYATGGRDSADAPKKKLPAALFSGTFSRRAADALKQHSGLICVDLDHLDERLPAIREHIESDPHTLTAFISPTGTGLKVIFRCDPARPHIRSFHAAERYVLEHFGLEIDPACKDVSRLCFVSYDPETFVADTCEPLPEVPEPVEFKAPHESKTGAALTAGDNPWDDYDRRCDFPALIAAEGWKHAGGVNWTRPDKASGVSATWNKVPGRFHVFTSSTQFEAGHSYKPWHVYAILHHGGDFSKAVAQLRRDGYGAPPSRPKTTPTPPASGNGTTPASPKLYDPGYEEPQNAHDTVPEAEKTIKPFTVWQPAQFRDYTPPPNLNFLGSGYLRRRQLTTLIGPPGVGKSRLSLWLGCCHIASRSFMDLDSSNGPAKWLFFGNENDPLRQKTDLEYFYKQMVAEEQELIDKNLFLHVLDQPDDGIITLADIDAYAKLIATLKSVIPDVVVFDPWGNMIEGNENDNEEVRRTLKLLLRAVGLSCPEAAILVIHHARTGKSTAIEAGNNFSGGSLGRGSKALVSSARCELALWPGHSEDSSRLVLTCEKVNNVKKFEPKGLVFENGIYRIDSTFDLDAWRDDIQGVRSTGKTLTIDDLVSAVKSGIQKKIALVEHCEETFEVSRATVTRRLKEAIDKGWLTATVPPGSYVLGKKAEPQKARHLPYSDD